MLSRDHLLPVVGINALNISGSPIRGIGGLGIVVVVVLSTLLQPGLWTLVVAGLVGGIALGSFKITHPRPQTQHGVPIFTGSVSGDDRRHLARGERH